MFRRLLIAATALSVVLPTVASAQLDESPRQMNRERQRVIDERQPAENPRETRRQPTVDMPSADRILRQLDVAPTTRIAPQRRVTVQEFKRRPDLRRAAPSIEIQAINFEFGSAEVPGSQYRKVEQIADALDRLISRRPGTRILIEGHTDAVGSNASNYALSERRAASLKRVLVREFGIPSRALETVGYGEEYLLVQTPYENWENRRVTLRRVDEFLR
jgi:outer membrane protein OmpA-like peptidoglycan-associated protein